MLQTGIEIVNQKLDEIGQTKELSEIVEIAIECINKAEDAISTNREATEGELREAVENYFKTAANATEDI